MPKLLAVLTVLLFAPLSLFADCSCRRIDKGETTHWGGNILIVQVEEKPYKDMKGVILAPGGDPLPGALVEIWTNPDYLLRSGPQTPEEASKQKRIKACRTGTDGKFCIHLKAGRYEVRVSVGHGWDVTKAYVIIDPQKGQNTGLAIQMVLGT
jgi:hypothetical protein